MKKKKKRDSEKDLKADWTEDQIISELCKMFSKDDKNHFPGYGCEDIYQECYIIGLEASKHFTPDGPASLFTYLYRCMKNRLYNLRRDKYSRTGSCTEVSRRVHSAEEIDEGLIIQDELFRDHETLIREIDERIPHDLRNDWKKMREFSKVSKPRRQRILGIIKNLIEDKVNG